MREREREEEQRFRRLQRLLYLQFFGHFFQEAFLGPQANSGIHQVFENPISNSFCLQYSCHFPLHFQRTGRMEMQTTYVPIPGMRPRLDQEKH